VDGSKKFSVHPRVWLLAYSIARATKLGDGGVFPFIWLHCEQAGTTSKRFALCQRSFFPFADDDGGGDDPDCAYKCAPEREHEIPSESEPHFSASSSLARISPIAFAASRNSDRGITSDATVG
jgi:hypothetical protein